MRARSVGSPFCRALGRAGSDGLPGTFGGWPSHRRDGAPSTSDRSRPKPVPSTKGSVHRLSSRDRCGVAAYETGLHVCLFFAPQTWAAFGYRARFYVRQAYLTRQRGRLAIIHFGCGEPLAQARHKRMSTGPRAAGIGGCGDSFSKTGHGASSVLRERMRRNHRRHGDLGGHGRVTAATGRSRFAGQSVAGHGGHGGHGAVTLRSL